MIMMIKRTITVAIQVTERNSNPGSILIANHKTTIEK